MKRLFLLVMFVFGLFLIFSPGRQLNPLKSNLNINSSSVIERLNQIWNKDIAYLRTLKGFPSDSEIASVNFIPGNRLSKFWLIKSSPNLPNPNEDSNSISKSGTNGHDDTSRSSPAILNHNNANRSSPATPNPSSPQKYFLEITLMAWAQENDHTLMVQYELFENSPNKPNRPKLWEFARTLIF